MITVRKFTEEDLPAILDIWNAVVLSRKAFPQSKPFGYEDGKKFFEDQTLTAVATDGEEVLGVYILHPNFIGNASHICNASFAVSEKSRGKGVGEIIVKNCMATAKTFGFEILQLNCVVATNTPALNLYKKLGFEKLGTIKNGFKTADGYVDICPHYVTL